MDVTAYTQSDISFLQPYDEVTPVQVISNVGHASYCVKRNSERFLLKVFERCDAKQIERINAATELCRELDCSSLRIIAQGKFEKTDAYYVVYNWLSGKNLLEASRTLPLSVEDNYRCGCEVGEKLLRLKRYTGPKRSVFPVKTIEGEAAFAVQELDKFLTDPGRREALYSHFSPAELDHMMTAFHQSRVFFEGETASLIHGDVARCNVFFDEDKHLHLIDLDSLRIGLDMMNFIAAYQIFHNPYELAFTKGVLDVLRSNRRGKDFNWQVIYILMFHFCISLKVFYTFGSEQFAAMMQDWRAYFLRVKDADEAVVSVI